MQIRSGCVEDPLPSEPDDRIHRRGPLAKPVTLFPTSDCRWAFSFESKPSITNLIDFDSRVRELTELESSGLEPSGILELFEFESLVIQSPKSRVLAHPPTRIPPRGRVSNWDHKMMISIRETISSLAKFAMQTFRWYRRNWSAVRTPANAHVERISQREPFA